MCYKVTEFDSRGSEVGWYCCAELTWNDGKECRICGKKRCEDSEVKPLKKEKR